MGCDIHLYIEYKSKNVEFDGYKHNWRSFGGRINPGRNYAMFALMADVRNYDGELTVLFEQRGMPADAAYYALSDSRLYISEHQDEGNVTPNRAEEWVKSGSSVYINGNNGEPTWVTNPDWHSHSWLNTSEFESVLNKYLDYEDGWYNEGVAEHNKFVKEKNIPTDSWMYAPPSRNIEPCYQAVLASLKRFEQLGYDARIVFWFDN